MTALATASPTPPTPEPVRRVHEVAEHLDCDQDLVYRLIKRGDLRAIRVGRHVRVPDSALAEFIARGGAH